MEAETKQWELLEAHKFRTDKIEIIIEDYGKEFKGLKE